MTSCRGLVAQNLIKKYGNRNVVDGVSLEVREGQIVGLLGPNGAGKSTTFYCIVGLIVPDDGAVFLDGENIMGYAMYERARKGITYLPQESSVFRKLSAAENIMAILEILYSDKQERVDKLNRFLKEFGIEHVANTRADRLSGGERRRVEICRALATEPRYILLDEPFAGIDPLAVKDLQELIRGLKDRNIGVLISDHNVRETLKVCDVAYIMHEGKILEFGTPEEIVESRRAREIYLGDSFKLI